MSFYGDLIFTTSIIVNIEFWLATVLSTFIQLHRKKISRDFLTADAGELKNGELNRRPTGGGVSMFYESDDVR